MTRTDTTPATQTRQDLRTPSWRDLPPAAAMAARAYLRAPAAHLPQPARRTLEALVSIAYYISLAVYRPLVHYWRDPDNPRRQILVSIVPNRSRALPAVRLLLGLATITTIFWVTAGLAHRNAIAAVILTALTAAGTIVTFALLVASMLAVWPYPGRIMRPGPHVPHTHLTASLAASTTPAGMCAVRAYLLTHHHGQRLTVAARDEHARAVYERLGLVVATPGRGRMTGIIGHHLSTPDRH